jgi:hypothetical protein
MKDFDDQVIPYEEAVRRHRALQEQRSKGVRREVQISDAMSHLLHDANAEDEEGPKPARLREIVAREFADEKGQGSGEPGGEPDGEPEGAFCSLDRSPDRPPR